MKIEAMTAYTEDEIKQWTAYWHGQVLYSRSAGGSEERNYPEAEQIWCLIYTWATAKAEAEMWEFATGHDYSDDDEKYHKALCKELAKHDWKEANFLAAVLQRIGWPQDDGQGEK